ncbi:MAG: PIN domain-containing protein [Sulfuricella sp.]
MTAKCFSDTNIVLYTIGQDIRKAGIARGIVATRPLVSAQVVNEAVNVCLRKLGFDREKAYAFADSVMRRTDVLPVDETTIRKSAELAIRYQLSNWDALIAAAAMLAGCDTLYSEDMQNGQVFESQLTVVNPFLSS